MISLVRDLVERHGPAGIVVAWLALIGALFILGSLATPLADRFELKRSGWRLHISRRWYRKYRTVLHHGEPWVALDWYRGDGHDPVIWVYVMSEGEDDKRPAEWVLLEALDPGPSWRERQREHEVTA